MTQQYTPVTWQDETTSQQGTLINAERLNQMQTAHHYADGFEEVDAVPTADPSVAYHKIVYCTADNTFYRWDGTEWTKDIDDETKALLQQEIARATEAEGELAQDIADETARATAQEQDLASRITAEASARNQADTTLGNRITAEATARESADTELGADIGAETARARQAEQANAQAIATHVADKQNPHEVTKAQVGLGNVDNTADLDKPVSIATQTALNEKASTTAVQAVTARVDTLESAVADTYNKSQTDTLLATKADQATTYTKTETDTLLAGYVTLNTVQTIPGAKTFTNTLAIQSGAPYIQMKSTSAIGVNQYLGFIQELDANGAEIFDIYPTTDSAGAVSLNVAIANGGTMKVPTPPAGATDTSAVNANWVSQSGDTSPNNLLHRNGDETKIGILTIERIKGRVDGYPIGNITADFNKFYRLITFYENANFVLKCKGNQPNNNIGWIEAFIGGTPIFQRSALLSKVSRYNSTSIIVCNNTSTNRYEVLLATGTLISGIVEVQLTAGYLGNTALVTLDEVNDPNTDGIHDNIQVIA